VREDRDSDRRVLIAAAGVMGSQVVLAALADAGDFALWVWLVLAVVDILVAGALFALGQRRATRRPAA